MQINITWKGIKPLVVHNNQTVDTLNPIAKQIKEISSKRKKTDADLEEMARLEWYGGLYLDDKTKEPIIPTKCLMACIRSGGKKHKLGKHVQESVRICNDTPIQYDGPRQPVEMWNDEKFRLRTPCKVGQASIIRTRPKFNDWKLDFAVDLDEQVLNPIDLKTVMETAGKLGLCDYRPYYGNFEVTKFEPVL